MWKGKDRGGTKPLFLTLRISQYFDKIMVQILIIDLFKEKNEHNFNMTVNWIFFLYTLKIRTISYTHIFEIELLTLFNWINISQSIEINNSQKFMGNGNFILYNFSSSYIITF